MNKSKHEEVYDKENICPHQPKTPLLPKHDSNYASQKNKSMTQYRAKYRKDISNLSKGLNKSMGKDSKSKVCH